MEVKETAKSAEQIFGDLFCQLLGGVPDDEITKVQQILVKAKYQAKSREMQNAPYAHSMSHQHMAWYHPVNPIYHQFNLQRLTRSNTK